MSMHQIGERFRRLELDGSQLEGRSVANFQTGSILDDDESMSRKRDSHGGWRWVWWWMYVWVDGWLDAKGTSLQHRS